MFKENNGDSLKLITNLKFLVNAYKFKSSKENSEKLEVFCFGPDFACELFIYDKFKCKNHIYQYQKKEMLKT